MSDALTPSEEVRIYAAGREARASMGALVLVLAEAAVFVAAAAVVGALWIVGAS